MSEKSSPAVSVAKERKEKVSEKIIMLANNMRVKVVPVSAGLIDEVTSMIKDPDPPVWHNPDKNRDELNASDPTYLKAINDASRERGVAVMDAMVMFGLELVDGLPQDDTWLSKLKIFERKGKLDLSEYDLESSVDKEFLFKRFMLADANLLEEISIISGISPEEVERAERSFRGN